MAGVEGRVNLRNKLKNHIKAVEKVATEDAQNAALEAGIEGLATARMVIATTPSSINPQKHNRIYTGLMYNSLDARVEGVRKIKVRVGWLRKKEDYFKIQDEGGRSLGHDITPMHALAAAQIRMREVLAERNIK